MADKCPRFTVADIEAVYKGSNGEATKAFYAQIETKGGVGILAVNLFRACKASERAKLYRGRARGRGSYRSMAYEKKEWSIGNLCEALTEDAVGISWGWGVDQALRDRDDPHHHVLYIDLPTGQVSFHTGSRLAGPDYAKGWDGVRGASAERICRWIAEMTGGVPAADIRMAG